MKKAQSLIEYGLILALVAVIAVTVLGKFGQTMNKSAETVNQNVSNATSNASKAYCDSIDGEYNESTGLCTSKNEE